MNVTKLTVKSITLINAFGIPEEFKSLYIFKCRVFTGQQTHDVYFIAPSSGKELGDKLISFLDGESGIVGYDTIDGLETDEEVIVHRPVHFGKNVGTNSVIDTHEYYCIHVAKE